MVFEGNTQKNCQDTYEQFRKLYEQLTELEKRNKLLKGKEDEKRYYMQRFKEIVQIEEHDPAKLRIYKRTLMKERDKYFTFLKVDGMPMTNNQAERRLRHIVLKRKVSYGCKTNKGAKILEILCSVVLTCWWKDPCHFISNYRHLAA